MVSGFTGNTANFHHQDAKTPRIVNRKSVLARRSFGGLISVYYICFSVPSVSSVATKIPPRGGWRHVLIRG